jgi:hypothetical protein
VFHEFIYNSPLPNSNEAWLTEFNNFLADICNNYDNVILAGDFNFRNIDWQSDIDVPTKGTSCEFLEILIEGLFLNPSKFRSYKGK